MFTHWCLPLPLAAALENVTRLTYFRNLAGSFSGL